MQNKPFNIFMAVTLAIVLGMLLCVLWLLMQVQSSSVSLVSMKNNTLALGAQDQQIGNFKNVYSGYSQSLQKINQEFVDPQNPVDFITSLETTASNAGLTPKITLLTSAGPANPNIMSFELQTSGDFSKILEFSQMLENGPYLVEIESVTLQSQNSESVAGGGGQDSNAKNPPSGIVDADFLINAFTQQP